MIEKGRHTYGDPEILTWNKYDEKVIVGNFTSIAKGVKIILNGEHNTDWITTFPLRMFRKKNWGKWSEAKKISGHPKSKGKVIIGNDVWIGRDSMILSGVTISDGAVIGARALVTKDVKPYTVVGGNPAKVIKKRFTDGQIKSLLKIKWWNWTDEKIRKNVLLLSSNKIDDFIKLHKNETE